MEALQIGLVSIACCILALSLIGNIALSVVVIRQLPCQPAKNYSYLILNLAISDVLLALSSIPFDIVERFTHPVFPFGSIMCQLLWPFQTVCSMASIFTVGALSYQRYRLIVQPCKGKLPWRTFAVILILIWILPVLLAGIPYSVVLRLDGNTTECRETWTALTKQFKMKLSFTAYLFIIQYILPLGLIVWCNVKAIYRLKRYVKHRRRTFVLCTLPIENHENAVKMLTMIVAVFALFWLPGQVMSILIEFQQENSFIIDYGMDIAYLFAFSNCVANPLIFAYYSKDHSNIVHLKRLTSKESSGNPTSSIELSLPRDCVKSVSPQETIEREPTNRLMKNFLEVIITMKEDRLRLYLDSTKETILN